MKRMTDREFSEWMAAKVAWHYRCAARLSLAETTTEVMRFENYPGGPTQDLYGGPAILKLTFSLFAKPKRAKKCPLPSKREIAVMKAAEYDLDDFDDHDYDEMDD